MRKALFLLIAGLMVIGFGGCASSMSSVVSNSKKPPKIYVHSRTPDKFKGIKPYQAIWNGLAPAVVKYNQIMQCDFTPEAVVALKEKGFEIVSDPKDADYRLDVEVLACGIYTKIYKDIDKKFAVLYNQRKEVPLEKKPLYRDFMEVAYDKNVPSYFSMIADKMKKYKDDPDVWMQDFYKYGILYSKNSRYFKHHTYTWEDIVTDGAQYQILASKNHILYPQKYAGMTKEDKDIINKWLKGSVKTDKLGEFRVLADTTGLSFVQLGGTLSNAGHSTLGGASAALGVAMALFGSRYPEAADRFTLTDLKTGKKVYVDREYVLAGSNGFRRALGKDDLDWVSNHLDDTFEKISK